jgi:hypothetical protein
MTRSAGAAAPHGGGEPPPHGLGPPFEVADLPEPLPFSARNAFRVIGPGAILAATAIGGGEWLIGPAQGVEHGLSLFWVATLAVFLQVVFNLEAARYTLYTGEPIYSGILRLRPGPRLWAAFYTVVAFLQLCWPALALLCATTLFSAYVGRLPEEGSAADARTVQLIAVGLIVLVLAILHFGGTVERVLELASWFMLAFVFLFLLFVNVWFIPAETWWRTLKGFLGLLPAAGGRIDWALLGALAATAGSGGVGNLTITNWMRDKGFGMGALTGAIPSAIGAREVKLSAVGKVFTVNAANLARWRVWCRYVAVDQVWVWGLLCFAGMFLNVNYCTEIIPPGTDLQGIGAGAYQARYMADRLWPGFWFLTLLNGFWILFSTQLGNTDILVRTITDVLWTGSRRVRAWRGGDVRAIYYLTLFAVSGFGLLTLWWAGAATMFKLLANMAGLILAVASVQILLVNRRFLPPALRPPLWRQAALAATFLVYGFFAAIWIHGLLKALEARLGW